VFAMIKPASRRLTMAKTTYRNPARLRLSVPFPAPMWVWGGVQGDPIQYYMNISQRRFYKISGLSKTSARGPSAASLSDPNSVGRFRPKGRVSVGHPALPFAASENRNLRGQHSFSMGFRTSLVSGARGCPWGGGWRLPASEICKGPHREAQTRVAKGCTELIFCVDMPLHPGNKQGLYSLRNAQLALAGTAAFRFPASRQ